MTGSPRERLERYRELARARRLTRRRFEALVAEALDSLPSPYRERIDNVAVVVEERPTREMLRSMGLGPGDTLLGLYQGVPLRNRGSSYMLVPPDRIILFRQPILARCRDEREVLREVRATLLHELGHHFGLTDLDLS